jgi:hypothetical protein
MNSKTTINSKHKGIILKNNFQVISTNYKGTLRINVYVDV